MKNTKLLELSIYLDRIKKFAYQDIAHIQNNVLNKNPYTSEFIKNYYLNKNVSKVNNFFIFNKIFIFYSKSLVNFFIFLSYASNDFELSFFFLELC